jgi:hypothetical protein
MTLAPGNRRFVLWMAHFALIIYVVQIVAIDHWHANPGDAVGVPDSNRHAIHCHGTSSCADGATMAPTALATNLTPLPPEPRLYSVAPSVASPADAHVDTLLQPPRHV